MFDDRYTDDEIDLWGSAADDGNDVDREEWTSKGWFSRYDSISGSDRLSPERVSAVNASLTSFVDTFGRADEAYTVRFGDATQSKGGAVQVSAAPLYDEALSDEDAARVLVGMACREATHSRYGKDHEQAVRAEFGTAESAAALSGMLADITDERAFAAEYPGWADVFKPEIDYLGKDLGGDPTAAGPLATGVYATRYSDKFDWTGNEAELAWWQNWAAQYGTAADGKAHVAGIREALEHINEPPPPPQGGGQGAGDDGEGQGQQGAGASGEGNGEGEGSGGGNEQSEGQGSGAGQPGQGKPQSGRELAGKVDKDLADSTGSAPGDAPGLGGIASTTASQDEAANQMLHDVASLDGVTIDLDVDMVQIYKDFYGKGLVEHLRARDLDGFRGDVRQEGSAASAIRNAFMRDRGGHSDITKGTTRGRCDNGSLHRIASNDNRLFHRRSTPSPDQWVVWVMVDWSTSMRSRTRQTLAAASALAAASRSVPTMRMAVKVWTTSQKSSLAAASVVDVWQTGESPERLGDAYRARMGGTPDAFAMAWAHKALKRELRGSERGMIVFLSDGEGFIEALRPAVQAARKDGLKVVSMALDTLSTQEAVYGKDNMVPYTGSITAAAGPLARLLTRVMSSGRK